MAGHGRLIIGIFALIIIILILIIITGNLINIPAIGFFYPAEHGEYVVGQTFSTDEADRIINISSNNFYVKQALGAHSNNSNSKGWNICYVTTERFLDIAPDVKNDSMFFVPRYRVLPLVVYDIGDPAYEGERVFAYVDPDQDYVAYLGFAVRDGIKGNWTYTYTGNGIRAIEAPPQSETILSSYEVRNLSIADTDIILPEDMTVQYKDRLLGIALNDSRVCGYLKGYNYEVMGTYINGFIRRSYWGTYYEDYPDIHIKLSDDVPGLFVTVNMHRGKVVNIRPPS